jgi:hypothetical protein
MSVENHVSAIPQVMDTPMAMIEFEDRDAASRRALLHYLETGEPEREHGADLVWAAACGKPMVLGAGGMPTGFERCAHPD